MQRLGEEISDHQLGGTVLNRNIARFHLVGNKETTNVKHTRLTAGTPLTINFQENRTLVVLEHSVNLDVVALQFQKQLRPKN